MRARDLAMRAKGTAARIATRVPLSGIVAVAVVCLAFAASYLALSRVVTDTQISGGIASLWFGAGPSLQRGLERRLRAWLPASVDLPTIAGFQRPWWQLALGGFVAITVAQLLIPVISLGGGPGTAFNRNIAAMLVLGPPVTAFAIGTLTGSRSDRYGVGVIVGAVLAGFVASQALTPLALDLTSRYVLGAGPAPTNLYAEPNCMGVEGPAGPTSSASPSIVTPPEATPPGGPPGAPPIVTPPSTSDPGPTPPDPDCIYGRGIDRFLLDNPLPLLLSAGLLGYWRGRRVQLAAYVGELLTRLPPGTRDSIVALAHEEAERLARTPPPAGPPRPPASPRSAP